MSANNFILIKKNYKKRWVMQECDAESQHIIFKIGWASTLEEAVEGANLYMGENEVEYGIRVSL